jgi:geranylgeranyl pyrophosphate synthase
VILAPELEEWVRIRRAEIDRLLDARVPPSADGDPGRLVEAVRYSLLAPGKRLRPLLALAAAEAVGGEARHPDEAVLAACCAVELVHCYSLIHDDLPSMDDDDFRRGRPSNHKAFGEATAILAGDALLTLAFEWIAEGGKGDRAPAHLRAALALARGAGMRGMVRGQARDLGEAPPVTILALERLHAEKTAALFRAAVEIGGAVAGAGDGEMSALAAYGERFGVAFQHADDLDDADQPALAGAARERLGALVAEAEAALAPLGARAARLTALAQAVGRR